MNELDCSKEAPEALLERDLRRDAAVQARCKLIVRGRARAPELVSVQVEHVVCRAQQFARVARVRHVPNEKEHNRLELFLVTGAERNVNAVSVLELLEGGGDG